MAIRHLPSQPEQGDAYSAVANLAGPELLDELHGALESTNPVEFALFTGAMRSTESKRYGQMVKGVGEFRPGIDQPTQLNIPATFAAERPQANRVRTDADIPRLVVVADLPERLHNTSGRLTLRTLGRYSVALALVMAQVARSRAAVILSNETGAGEVFDDLASGSHVAMEALDGNPKLPSTEGKSPLAAALEIAEATIIPQRDVALVVSDFMDGHEASANGTDWQESLARIDGSLEDRLLTVRLSSPAQAELPVGLSGLPLDRVQAVRERYHDLADAKARRISTALQHMRHIGVEAANSEVHPIAQINNFLVGEN